MKYKSIIFSIFAVIAAFTISSTNCHAQQHDDLVKFIEKDGKRYKVVGTDTIALPKTIFEQIAESKGKTNIRQTPATRQAFEGQIELNKERKTSGYRIRIFFDNKQSARKASETVLQNFKEAYPNIPVYRIYKNPYFTVSVGNYINKSDAIRALELIKPQFPNAIVLKDNIL